MFPVPLVLCGRQVHIVGALISGLHILLHVVPSGSFFPAFPMMFGPATVLRSPFCAPLLGTALAVGLCCVARGLILVGVWPLMALPGLFMLVGSVIVVPLVVVAVRLIVYVNFIVRQDNNTPIGSVVAVDFAFIRLFRVIVSESFRPELYAVQCH